MDAGSFWIFLISITLLTISPGVDTVLVIRNATRGGVADGLVTTVAICTGLFVHATVSAVGISVILLESAFLFGLLKLAGAAYLIWLGVVSVGQALKGGGSLEIGGAAGSAFIPLRSIREGFLSNVLNPKPIVFYMAFLPQFIDPDKSALEQSLLLALIHFRDQRCMAWAGCRRGRPNADLVDARQRQTRIRWCRWSRRSWCSVPDSPGRRLRATLEPLGYPEDNAYPRRPVNFGLAFLSACCFRSRSSSWRAE
ncbi:MAG: LysE family translocator [Gammaproteobacteria bacterium]|nr:LysE family translocator [Gammaproteobacteria bacterium]